MGDLTSLIERIEAATEGSRELDCFIFEFQHRLLTRERRGTIDGVPTGRYFDLAGNEMPERSPTYSTSIDAALTLLPEGLEFDLTNLYGVAAVGMGINTESPCYARREDGNITLALLAAILRARQTEAR